MKNYDSNNILGFNIFIDDVNKVVVDRNKIVINTINAYSYTIAKKDTEFINALLNSNILLPDGFGFVIAAKLLNNIRIHKVAGYDVFLHLMNLAEKNCYKVFFLGSTVETLRIIKNKLDLEYPNIKADFYSPPFVDSFSNEETQSMLEVINSFKPEILFVGMTAPKQEKWVARNFEDINARIISSVGAVFEFYAGNKKRAPKIFIKLGLEWLHRLISDPKHMLVRYKHSPITNFLFDVVKEKFRKNYHETTR